MHLIVPTILNVPNCTNFYLLFKMCMILSTFTDIPYRAKLCRAKVTSFLRGDENFARRIISPNENFARQSFAR